MPGAIVLRKLLVYNDRYSSDGYRPKFGRSPSKVFCPADKYLSDVYAPIGEGNAPSSWLARTSKCSRDVSKLNSGGIRPVNSLSLISNFVKQAKAPIASGIVPWRKADSKLSWITRKWHRPISLLHVTPW